MSSGSQLSEMSKFHANSQAMLHHGLVFVFVVVIIVSVSVPSVLITLIKCLKGHKSLEFLFHKCLCLCLYPIPMNTDPDTTTT